MTVRVTSPAGARKQKVFKIRSRKLPVRTTQCSVAGTRKFRPLLLDVLELLEGVGGALQERPRVVDLLAVADDPEVHAVLVGRRR